MKNKDPNIITSWISQYQWCFHILLALFGAVIAHLLIRFLANRMKQRLKHTPYFWDVITIKALYKPVIFSVWLIAFLFIGDVLNTHFTWLSMTSFLDHLYTLGFAFLFIWALWRFVSKIESAYLEDCRANGKHMDPTKVDAIGKGVRIVILLFAALIVAQVYGFPISGILAFGGGGAIVVGIAAKDLLANFFGGFIIHLGRPFSVGDWIQVTDKTGLEGTVQAISWRVTEVLSFEKRPIYIPNMIFLTSPVMNNTRMRNRRIKTTFSVRYDDAKKVKNIVANVEYMIKAHPEIDHTVACMVNFVNFGASSLDIQIYCFTKTKDWATYLAVQQDVFIKVLETVEACGAEMAFPTTTIHAPDFTQEK